MTNGLFWGCFGHFNMYHHLKIFKSNIHIPLRGIYFKYVYLHTVHYNQHVRRCFSMFDHLLSYIMTKHLSCDPLCYMCSGEIEITCDQSQFRGQYEEQWREMETLLPGLLPRFVASNFVY